MLISFCINLKKYLNLNWYLLVNAKFTRKRNHYDQESRAFTKQGFPDKNEYDPLRKGVFKVMGVIKIPIL